MGMAGIPQPKPGAVTKAHGGVLFIDEIGELHPIQMNKMLKVLEDRKVFLESAYYSSRSRSDSKPHSRHLPKWLAGRLPLDWCRPPVHLMKSRRRFAHAVWKSTSAH